VFYVRGEHERSSSLDDIDNAGATVLEYAKADVKVGETSLSITVFLHWLLLLS